MPSNRRKIKRIPALDKNARDAAETLLDRLPVDAQSRRLLKQMIAAAADPRSDTPEKNIQTLPAVMQQNVKALTSDLRTLGMKQLQGARARLDDIDGDEWERLLDEAYGDGENPA